MPDPNRIHKPLYRVFHLNRAGGIDRAEIVEALDDEDAIGRVRVLADDHAIELWDRARFIAKVEPPLLAVGAEPVVIRAAIDPVDVLADGDAAVVREMKLAH